MLSLLERHFEAVDRIMVLVLAVVMFVLGHVVNHDAFVHALLAGNRIAVYGIIIGLFGTIFGFGLTAMAIVLAFAESPRLHLLRGSRHWATLWRVFTRGIRTFLIVVLFALAAMITGTSTVHSVCCCVVRAPRSGAHLSRPVGVREPHPGHDTSRPVHDCIGSRVGRVRRFPVKR